MQKPKIGIGGAGRNILNALSNTLDADCITISMNENEITATGKKELFLTAKDKKIKLAEKIYDKEKNVSYAWTKTYEKDINLVLAGAEHIFLLAGLGGSTGLFVTPKIARIAGSMATPVTAIIIKPFDFEGHGRLDNFNKGLEQLKLCLPADHIIIKENEQLLKNNKNPNLTEAFKAMTGEIAEILQR
jgi:cell division protein FtsZ